MSINRHFWLSLAIVSTLSACRHAPQIHSHSKMKSSEAVPPVITTHAKDNITIYGENYMGELDKTAPLILLFHQGGSNGRGEYHEIAQWLNTEGFRVIAWDQRSGGSIYGSENRTVAGLEGGKSKGYCEAYPDLQAALDYTRDNKLAEDVIVWGSSYSGALVFRLALENPDFVKSVIAFSPASGDPLKGCRARLWVNDVKSAMKVYKPVSEMERESSQTQKSLFEDAGVSFEIIENGVHGSSMLVDERTEADMSKARTSVVEWLKKQTQ